MLDNLPLSIGSPIWLINSAVSVVDNSFYALIGLLLIALANGLGPKRSAFRPFARSCFRLAVAVCLGYLLLIPLLWHATRRSEAILFTAQAQRVEVARARLDGFRSRIVSASTTREIAALLKAEQGVNLSKEDLQRPPDALRLALLNRLDEARRQLPNTSIARRSWRWGAVQRSLRISLMAFAYAFAFASLAQRRNSPVPVLQEAVGAFFLAREAFAQSFHQRSSRRASARAFREDIRRARASRDQRHLQDQRDRAMAEAFDAAEAEALQPADRSEPEAMPPGSGPPSP